LKLRFVCATGLILLTAILLQARGRTEIIARGLPLATFPAYLGNWHGSDIALDPEVLAVLGPGDFLLRDYENHGSGDPPIGLFIAYFPSQRAGDTIHSPKHCLPGAGWEPVDNQRVRLSLPGHQPFPANRYVVAKGEAHELVLYWYWAHDRGIASEYWAKYYLVRDSIRMNRSDGALIRITTPMFTGETPEEAQQRVLPFADSIGPLINDYIPR
jgi:EpsI family protein